MKSLSNAPIQTIIKGRYVDGALLMDNLENYADKRNQLGCIHCGMKASTKDHVPSRVFLDKPYPYYPPVLPSCFECNNSLSLDEEYFACLIECALVGDANPALVRRPKIKSALLHSPALSSKISSAKQITTEGVYWLPEMERVKRVILKLARGHVAYEHNEWRLDNPLNINTFPLTQLTEYQREQFEVLAPSYHNLSIWPEVGTRAMQRLCVFGESLFTEMWIEVQEGRYRYLVDISDQIIVRIVFSEYLGAEIIWPLN